MLSKTRYAPLAVLIALLGVSCASPTSAEQEVITPQELLATSFEDGMLKSRSSEVRGLSMQWTADASALLMSRPAKNGAPASISHLDIASGDERLIAEGTLPKLSPDGSLLGFSDSDGTIVIGQLDGAEFEELAVIATRPKDGSASLGFSPADFAISKDNRRVAFVRYREFVPSLGTEGHPELGLEAVSPELWVLDLQSGAKTHLFTPPSQPESPIESDLANPQLANLVYGADDRLFFAQGFGSFYTGFDTHLYTVREGEAPILFAEDVANQHVTLDIRMSPDASLLVGGFTAAPDFLTYGAIGGRAIIDTTTGARTNLHTGPYSGSRGAVWAPDNNSVYFKCKPGAFAGTLCQGDAKTGEIIELTILEEWAQISSLTVSPNGEKVAWLSWDREDSFRLKLRDIDGGPETVLWEKPSPVSLQNKALGESRLVRWTSFDGLEFEGLLILPVGYEEGDQVPLVVDIHGGAAGGLHIAGSLLNSSPLEHQVWAGMGYAVFLADYRKGIVAKNDLEAVRRVDGMSFHEGDAADVIAGIEHVIDLGVADPNRIVAIGHSYGSAVLNELITRSDILTLAISKEGHGQIDVTKFATSLDPQTQPAVLQAVLYMWRATPETLLDVAKESSPLFYAENVKTPTLLITAGMNNPDLIERQRNTAEAFAGAIDEAGAPVQSLFFPNDYHIIAHEENVREMMDVTIEWMERYIGVPSEDGQANSG